MPVPLPHPGTMPMFETQSTAQDHTTRSFLEPGLLPETLRPEDGRNRLSTQGSVVSLVNGSHQASETAPTVV